MDSQAETTSGIVAVPASEAVAVVSHPSPVRSALPKTLPCSGIGSGSTGMASGTVFLNAENMIGKLERRFDKWKEVKNARQDAALEVLEEGGVMNC